MSVLDFLYCLLFAVIIRAIAPCHIGEDTADE